MHKLLTSKTTPEIKPLTRQTSQHTSRKRETRVELQIKEALSLEHSALIARATIQDNNNPQFLQEETLTYLLRTLHLAQEEVIASSLASILVQRCTKYIHGKLKSLGEGEGSEAYTDVVGDLINRIIDPDSDRGDFFQVRFWFALKRLIISTFDRYIKRVEPLIPLADFIGDEMEVEDTESDGQRRPTFRASIEDTSLTGEQSAMIKDALAHIVNPNHRRAYLLHKGLGLPIESNDPTEPTLSTHFHKTPRTITNWLRKAEKDLESWRG